MSYSTIQVDKICRTCLSEENNMRSVFSIDDSSGQSIGIFEMLMSCASVQVLEDDGLPNKVCMQCVDYIARSFTFKQLCERSEATLRQLLGRPLEPTFLELKPLITQEAFLEEQLPEATINTVTAVTDSVEQVTHIVTAEDLTAVGTLTFTHHELSTESENNQHLFIKEKSGSEIHISSTENELLDTSQINSLSPTDVILDEETEADDDANIGVDDGLDSIVESTTNIVSIVSNDSAPDNETITNVENNSNGGTDISQSITNEECKNIEEFDVQKKTARKKRIKDDTLQPLYPCEECTLCFTTLADLKVHAKSNHKVANHVCKVCNQTFASASTLCRHTKVHEGARRHLCSECGKGFLRSDDLTRHLRTHTGEKPFSCKECGKSFAQSFRLLEHLRAHANQKGFVCYVCGKAFSRYTSLAAHNKTHSGIKSHACSVCGKRLCGAGSLTMHMKTHTGLKDHICPFCGKGFTTPSNLIIHKRTHTGERPYVCNVCGKGFPDPSRLTVHNRSHSGEKPYICSICGRGCVSSSQLKKHIRIHTGEKPYICTLCPKAFPRSEDLRIHIKTHTGDRNHVCNYCQKGFYQASTLKVHLRIHTGEKPYQCNICEKAFSQTGPLSTHMKTHQH